MADNNNMQVEQEEKQPKRIPYESASESCSPLDSLVPISFAKEQIFFNRTLKVEVGDVDEYVKEKLKYQSVDALCKAFAREQIDAVATAIYNWEATGNAIIVSDQTGLGKGRIVAGLIRYSILHLKEYPVFFTEKKNLFSDIYRDLFDIGLDAAIPIKIKKQVVMISEEDLTEKIILKEIKKDIATGDLRVDFELPEDDDFELKDILKNDFDEDMFEDLIDLYRLHILENGIIEGREYEKIVENPSDTEIKNLIKRDIESLGTIRFIEATRIEIENLFDKSQASFLKKVIDAYKTNLSIKEMTQNAEKENRIRVQPFCPFDIKIKNKQGDILYEVSATKAKDFVTSNKLDVQYRESGLMLMLYTTLQRGIMTQDGQLQPKGKFVIEKCQNRIIILDESHNSAGQSNRFRIMSLLLRQAKYVSYVSATWAKRPDNMPIYAIRTAIKDSYLSIPQIVNAFTNGGLALQEAVSSNLVQDGQLIRREKEIEGEPTYYTESDQSDVGLNQIAKLNDVASIWQSITFELAEFYKAFLKVRDRIDAQIEGIEEKEARKRFKIAGKVNRQLFLVFNYFLLGLKVRQAANQAVKELKEGRKVVLAIANTLESAFSNIKKNYSTNESYTVGDRVPNDFAELLKYMASYILQIKYVGIIINDEGKEEEADIKVNLWDVDITKSTGNENLDMIIRALQPEWTERINSIIEGITDTAIPLSPIDQIKAIIQNEGFTIDEITGRTKMLEFVDGDNYDYGILSKRVKTDKMDIINRFNSNELDAVIINQSGSTGLSLHALPTMLQGKIMPPVYVVPTIPPNSLLPNNEVKQRCMIILQMELNVSTEIQKLGRVNRNGQVFPPKYIYIISAIPSEARLSAMMQRKLQSLMATTAGSQEFGQDLFSHDDLFSDNAVSVWNETCDDYNLPTDYKVATGEDIYQRTKLFYLVNYDLQKNFYFTLSNKLQRKIEELKKLGQYFQAIQYKDYRAVSKQVIPFIIGNNEALSVFGKHTFAELVEVTEIGQKNFASTIKKEISSSTYLLMNSDTQKFPNFELYLQKAEESTQAMVDVYNSGYFEDNTRQKESITAYQAELDSLKKGLSKFGSLEKILGLEKIIEEKEKRKKELAQELPQIVMRGEDATVISQQLQELSKEVENNRQELSKTAKGQSASEMQSEKRDLERDIKNSEKNIENAKIRIEKNEKQIANQILYRGYYINFLKSVGKIFDVTILDERLQALSNEDASISDYEYEYATNTSEPMVLTAVRFSQNSNYYFTLGEIDLVFHSVTESYTFNLSNLYREYSEEELRRKKKHQYEIKDTDVTYETQWDIIVSKIDTSYTTEKVMLSGDLLRGLAFNSLTNFSGHIVKYSTFENKLKISLELNKDSTDLVKPRFNEGNNYVILFGLSVDNIQRVMPYMLAKKMLTAMVKNINYSEGYENYNERPSELCVSTQFLYSRDNVYLAFYPSLNLFKKIESFYEDAKDKLSNDYDLYDNTSDLFNSFVEMFSKIIRENLDGVRFCISTDAADFLTYFENILFNTGAEAYQYDSDYKYSGISLLYSTNEPQYSLYEASDTKAVQKKRLNVNASALGVNLSEIQDLTKKYSFYKDGDLYTGVYLVSRDVIQSRAIDVRQNYFNPLYNMSMTFSALDKIINFLQAQNTQIVAATSADPVYAAEPKYIFNVESSTKGLISDIQIESIETLGNDKIQAIEDVINEFVALYEEQK